LAMVVSTAYLDLESHLWFINIIGKCGHICDVDVTTTFMDIGTFWCNENIHGCGHKFSNMALYHVGTASLNIVIRASLIYRGIDMIID